MSCPNCDHEHGAKSSCLLGVVAGVVRDRGEGIDYTAEDLALVDVDEFWEAVGGPAADWLEKHIASRPERG